MRAFFSWDSLPVSVRSEGNITFAVILRLIFSAALPSLVPQHIHPSVDNFNTVYVKFAIAQPFRFDVSLSSGFC